MQVINSPINPNDTGKEVSNLQAALQLFLDIQIIATFQPPDRPTAEELIKLSGALKDEKGSSFFGDATRQLVLFFQLQQGLSDQHNGAVEEITAAKMNEILKASGALNDAENKFIVKGFIRNADGTGVANTTVVAFDRNMRPIKLGKTTTNEKGYYEISYSADVFSKTGKKNPDLFAAVLDENGQSIESETIPNAVSDQEINLTMPQILAKEKTEWELTNNQVLPMLKGLKQETGTDNHNDLQPEELKQADFDFITKKTGLEKDRLSVWSLAYARSKDATNKEENPLLPEIFYGWFRMRLPMELKDLWAKTNDELLQKLKEAIDKNIIPDVSTELEKIIAVIENIRSQLYLNSEAGLRLKLFKKSLGDNIELHAAFEKLFADNKGDWTSMEPILRKDFSDEVVDKLSFTHDLASWTGDNEKLITHLKDTVGAKSFRDITLTLDRDGIEKMIKEQAVLLPDGITATAKADELFTGLYQQDATGVIIKMASDKKLPFKDNEKIAALLNTPGFEIKINSVYELLKSENFLKNIPDDIKPQLTADIKTTQRIALISPDDKSFTTLIDKKYNSAFQITLLPRNQFVASMNGSGLPEETLRHIYATAQDKKALYEQMLVNIREAYKGSGVAVIEGTMSTQNYDGLTQTKKSELKKTLEDHNISWDLLFGDADFCECGECTSMYSPAAYYVELLQYLRNNNLDADAKDGTKINPDPKKIDGTPLEKLFKRRPDLGHLELTCKNTNTILPYVDLVNEVMEQYIAFTNAEPAQPLLPPITFADYKGFNVAEETSGELLSAPQHTEQEKAYQTLSKAVFPFTLPYHQPIDAARIFLNYLGSSRYELLDTFNVLAAEWKNENAVVTIGDNDKNFKEEISEKVLLNFYSFYLKTIANAEFLNISMSEYALLTKTVFVSYRQLQKNSFIINERLIAFDDKQFEQLGLLPVYKHYGYSEEEKNTIAKEHDRDEWYDLSFVKTGFLPRTGIEYTDLVELLKTQYLNPNLPKGINLTILHSLANNYSESIKLIQPIIDKGTFEKEEIIKIFKKKSIFEYREMETEEVIVLLRSFLTETENAIVLESRDNSCNIDEVKLLYIDGKPLSGTEYEKLHRFIRLWRKLGFTIDETDKAIMALGVDKKSKLSDITPDLIRQLVAVKKIINLTGIELTKLLCFWGDISTAGENSLYKRLFLTHNLLALDKIFKPVNEIYLTPAETITAHLPAVMAALNLTADDIEAIRTYNALPPADFKLSIANLSLLYRYRLLSKTMGLKVPVFIKLAEVFLKVFGDVFSNADTTLQFLQNWGKIEEAGFNAEQVSYIINGTDRNIKPFAPSEREVLVFAKQLCDGLNDIEATHGNVKDDAEATTELVRAKALLLFAPAVTEQIISILDAPVTFTTHVDRNLNIDWPDPNILKDKVGYDKSSGILTITGVLNDTETLVFNNLKNKAVPAVPGSPEVPATATTPIIPAVPASPEVLSVLLPLLWSEGLSEIVMLQNTQVQKMRPPFQLVLSGLLGSTDALRDSYCNIEEPAKKRFAFLNAYLPFLRIELNKKLITDLLANASALDKTIVQALAFNILRNGSVSLFNKLAAIKESGFQNVEKAYLLPQVSTDYTFVVNKDKIIQPYLNGEKISFDFSVVLPNDSPEYRSLKSEPLEAVKVYSFSVPEDTIPPLSLKDIFWKTPVTVSGSIPSSQLIPQEVFDICMDVLTPVKKLALLISTFKLSADELNYLQTHGDDFSALNFNHLELPAFLRITDYCSLRNSLPQTKTNILEFLKWVTNKDSDEKDLITKISALTSWNAESIAKLVSSAHFNLSGKANFRNEQKILKLQKALAVAGKIGVDIDKLFEWALPANNFMQCKEIANSIQKAIRSRYNQTDWEQVVKPLNDQLRNNQKNALIAYLLQQEELKNKKVKDADGLFEYFLIDVQMDTCMETSRIKQAISSVQLFIQRCFIGLESKIEDGNEKGIGATVLDRTRWEWMQRYRVWEANRKILLYPENWIESNLRDDKSPFFKELESELLQKDINKQNVTDALKTYLYKVDEVANMEVVGLYIEGSNSIDKDGKTLWSPGAKLHVFSRTRNAPYFFYYRYLGLDEMNWYPWEKMQVDIPSYDVEDAVGKITGNGCYLTPVVWNGRLLIFFPQIMKKTKANPQATGSVQSLATDTEGQRKLKPIEYWEIKIAWSEYRNGKWTQKQLSKQSIVHIDNPSTLPKGNNNIDDEIIALNEQIKSEFNNLETAENKFKDDRMSKIKEHAQFKSGSISVDTITESDILVNFQLMYLDTNVISTFSERLTVRDDDNVLPIIEAQIKVDTLMKTQSSFEKIRSNNDNGNGSMSRIMLANIAEYGFLSSQSDDLQISVIYQGENNTIYNSIGLFMFNGSSVKVENLNSNPDRPIFSGYAKEINYFHHVGFINRTLQNRSDDLFLNPNASDMGYYFYFEDEKTTKFNSTNFHQPYTHNLLGIINNGQLELFFKYNLDKIADIDDAFGNSIDSQKNKIYHELKRPYSLYNWELFFHTPIMIATALSKAQQFEEAMKWFHYVFNPIIEGTKDNRFWQFAPFKEINSKNILEQIFGKLDPNTANSAISAWRNNPFKPHLVARDRPVAYMKWVVMKYIENIVEWGDYLYRQDTIESINQATQMYVLAGHILGRRPMMIPKRGEFKPQTYISLLDKWDANSDAMSEMEVAAVQNIQEENTTRKEDKETATTDLYGTISALYFCIPNNPKLLGYWDTIADRLFKIRHCQNIEGVFRKLPLFEPPIDPALLVKAAAQGLSISSVVNDLNTAMPNYRFYYLLQKALELCNELKSLGGAMLSAIEKKDNETIAVIRARHEGTMNNLVMEIKKLQLEEAQKSLDSLKQNRKAPEARMTYYLQLAGEDVSKIPTVENEFTEFANSIEKPFDESGLRLSRYEKEDMDKSNEARALQIEVGQKELLASIFHLLPNLNVDLSPLGVGSGFQYGGSFLGNAMQAWAKGLQNEANGKTFVASTAAKKGGFQRALQERIQQANAAGFELKQIDKQITAQQIRIDIANKEINNHQKQIDNANEVEEFLKNKYTNEELYTWMRGSLKTLYKQVYNLAYDLAKKAEKTYCFERGISNANFIQSGYFDAGREGLLAGEQLYVGLKQLEAAYQEKRGYDYEITKHISLRQLDPFALLQLKVGNYCEFNIPEVLFDMDFPGHYKRRIKSVSISIPCIAGPYTSVNATLQLMNNKFRNSAIAKKDGTDYPEKLEDENRFISYNIPITAIATSSAQNDSGMFELNFKDERYLPFEGAGVINGWNLELPERRQFDYNTISDVVLHVKYIATEGGDNLKDAAKKSVVTQLNSIHQQLNETGLHIPISLKHDMPNEFNMLKKNYETEIKIDKDRFPYFAQALNLNNTSLLIIAKEKITILKKDDANGTPVNFIQLQKDLFKAEIAILNSTIKIKINKQLNNEKLTEIESKQLDEMVMIIKYELPN